MILPMYENIAMATMRRFVGALGLSRGSEIEHADTMIRSPEYQSRRRER